MILALEAKVLLEELWHDRRLGEGRRPFRLVFVHAMAENVKSFAKSQIEWLNSSIADAFNFDDAITWSEKFDQKPQPEMSRDEYIDLEFE